MAHDSFNRFAIVVAILGGIGAFVASVAWSLASFAACRAADHGVLFCMSTLRYWALS